MNYTDELIQENVELIEEFLKKFTYKDKWVFGIRPSIPRAFVVGLETFDSTKEYSYSERKFYELQERTLGHNPSRFIFDTPSPFQVAHTFTIPPHTFTDQNELERYVLDRILDVELHEAMEAFKVLGYAPFFPDHDNVNALYAINSRRK